MRVLRLAWLGIQTRSGSYFPGLLEPAGGPSAPASVIQLREDVSTRKVDSLVQALGMDGVSRSEVSRICAELDAEIKAFLPRPIEEPVPTTGSTRPSGS